MVYIDGFVDYNRLDLSVIKPILDSVNNTNNRQKALNITSIVNEILLPCDFIEIEYMQDVQKFLYAGYSVLFLDNSSKALAIMLKGYNKRDTSKTEIENTVRGPKEAFVESADVNLTLLNKNHK